METKDVQVTQLTNDFNNNERQVDFQNPIIQEKKKNFDEHVKLRNLDWGQSQSLWNQQRPRTTASYHKAPSSRQMKTSQSYRNFESTQVNLQSGQGGSKRLQRIISDPNIVKVKYEVRPQKQIKPNNLIKEVLRSSRQKESLDRIINMIDSHQNEILKGEQYSLHNKGALEYIYDGSSRSQLHTARENSGSRTKLQNYQVLQNDFSSENIMDEQSSQIAPNHRNLKSLEYLQNLGQSQPNTDRKSFLPEGSRVQRTQRSQIVMLQKNVHNDENAQISDRILMNLKKIKIEKSSSYQHLHSNDPIKDQIENRMQGCMNIIKLLQENGTPPQPLIQVIEKTQKKELHQPEEDQEDPVDTQRKELRTPGEENSLVSSSNNVTPRINQKYPNKLQSQNFVRNSHYSNQKIITEENLPQNTNQSQPFQFNSMSPQQAQKMYGTFHQFKDKIMNNFDHLEILKEINKIKQDNIQKRRLENQIKKSHKSLQITGNQKPIFVGEVNQFKLIHNSRVAIHDTHMPNDSLLNKHRQNDENFNQIFRQNLKFVRSFSNFDGRPKLQKGRVLNLRREDIQTLAIQQQQQ